MMMNHINKEDVIIEAVMKEVEKTEQEAALIMKKKKNKKTFKNLEEIEDLEITEEVLEVRE